MKHLLAALFLLFLFAQCKPRAVELYQPGQPTQYRLVLQLRPQTAPADYGSLIDSAKHVLNRRLLEFQLIYNKLEADAQTGRLMVDIVGPADKKSTDKTAILEQLTILLTTEGRLEFWDLYKKDEGPYQQLWMPLSKHTDFFGYVPPSENTWDVAVARFPPDMVDTVNRFLLEITQTNPLPGRARFAWSLKPSEYNNNWYELFVLQGDRTGAPPLNNQAISEAFATVEGSSGDIQVSLNFNEQGKSIWAAMTERAAAEQRSVAIVLDGRVITAPRVISPITEGKSSISGDFTAKEAADLAKTLKVGAYPCPVEVLSAKTL